MALCDLQMDNVWTLCKKTLQSQAVQANLRPTEYFQLQKVHRDLCHLNTLWLAGDKGFRCIRSTNTVVKDRAADAFLQLRLQAATVSASNQHPRSDHPIKGEGPPFVPAAFILPK